jgi:transcriptional regulator with XRE-family HTH domain
MEDDRLGARLRAERERRKIALEHVAANTKIGIGLLRDLERDELSRWPTGIFRRSFVRAYAQGIGVDPDETLEEFLRIHPDPPSYGAFGQSPLAGGSSAAALARIARVDREAAGRRPGAFRLLLADEPHPFMAGGLLRGVPHRLAAALWDVATPVLLALLVYLLIDRFWIPLAIILAAYHAGSVLALGNTPGVYFFAPSALRRGADAAPDADTAEDLADSMFHPRGA